jgi:plastocyanin
MPPGSALPYIQSDYDRQAKDQAEDVLGSADDPTEEVRDFPRSKNEVLMVGNLTATGGGRQYLAIDRFFPETIYISKGETVEFTNADPEEPHTVTSGKDDSLTNDQAPVGLGIPASDLALTATATSTNSPTWGNASPTSGVNSGFLQASPEDAVARAQAAPGTTRIRITFNAAGTFYYHCALHDVDGMQGKVVVNP